jgi:hypothetical protein
VHVAPIGIVIVIVISVSAANAGKYGPFVHGVTRGDSDSGSGSGRGAANKARIIATRATCLACEKVCDGGGEVFQPPIGSAFRTSGDSTVVAVRDMIRLVEK